MNSYLYVIKKLLPCGRIWNVERGSAFERLLHACSQEFGRIDQRISELQQEIDPRTTQECISEWEKMFRLPQTGTLQERRERLMRRIHENYTSSTESITRAAQDIGIDIRIFDPLSSASVHSPQWDNVCLIECNLKGDPNKREALEACLEKLRPAHIKTIIKDLYV